MNKEKNSKTTRIPIITIAGHIDHGKTTLLNCLNKKFKPEFEYGGITQYIKPYIIDTDYGKMTFLDTPGHFAFNSIRKKSIIFSDILILIISIDDGVMPQTIEVVEIAKNFNIPIIIAINKIDKVENPDLRVEKIINDLSKYNLVPEKWGGDVLMAYISAKTGFGIKDLLDLINFQAEMLDLKSDINSPAEGFVLDSKIDLGKGNITTLIILNGFLKKGDIVQVKNKHGKIKNIIDFSGNIFNKIDLSIPIYVTGLPNDIDIGEKFFVVNNPSVVKDDLEVKKRLNIKDLMKNVLIPEKKKINFVIKADVRGSANVLKDVLNSLSNDKVFINLVKLDIGNLNTSDVDLAVSTNSFLIGFNVKCDSKTKKLAESNLIKIHFFNIIYDLTDFIKQCVDDSFDVKENIIGTAIVKRIFKLENLNVAGCLVASGKVKQNSFIRIFRKNLMVHQGFIDSIKIFKDNVSEVKSGIECGIIIKDYNNIQINDKIKVYLKDTPERS